jgi:glycosyltransferase involved in cell wall biosynthesis
VDVLYFADTRFPIERANGIQTMATCHALAARGHRVILVVRPDTARPPRDPFAFYGLDPQPTLTVTAVPGRGGRSAARLAFLAQALLLIRRDQDAIVYTRDLGVAAWVAGLPRAIRPRLVYESHGIAAVVSTELPALLGPGQSPPSPAKLRRLERREARVWRRANACVVLTTLLASDLEQRHGPRANVFVVPDGAHARSPDPSVQPPRDKTVAGYAGHLYPWKGVDVFVRALALAPAVWGLIVGGHPGEADRARVDRLAQEVGVSGRLTITGLVPPADVAGHLAAASILVLPNTSSAISERFTSPLKLFEYLWFGRPIVASDLPAIREVLTDGETALLVPPGDAAALANAFERLASDPALAARIGRAARDLAPAFTWARRAERLEAALDAARRT